MHGLFPRKDDVRLVEDLLVGWIVETGEQERIENERGHELLLSSLMWEFRLRVALGSDVARYQAHTAMYEEKTPQRH